MNTNSISDTKIRWIQNPGYHLIKNAIITVGKDHDNISPAPIIDEFELLYHEITKPSKGYGNLLGNSVTDKK